MKARILTTASILTIFSGALPAADPQLLNLVMPDVKVLADVNVTHAKSSPFGQYVLSQAEMQQLQTFKSWTGFDPSNDLTELMFAGNGAPGPNRGLALATGVFNVSAITAAAAAKGAASTTYKGATIILNPPKTEGVAFLAGGNIMVAGSVANVEAAIDRSGAQQPTPAALMGQAALLSQLSAEDAWILCTVPPASLHQGSLPPAAGVNGLPQNVAAQIQQGWASVKFGANVIMTAQAQADNAQDATNLANALQLLINLGQMQASQNSNAPNVAAATSIATQDNNVNIAATLPEAQFEQLIQAKPKAAVHRVPRK